MSQTHRFNIGDEFLAISAGCSWRGYIVAMPGEGTHYWDGERIVPKEEQKPVGGGNTAPLEGTVKTTDTPTS